MPQRSPQQRPLIGITADVIERSPGRLSVAAGMAYCEHIRKAGGSPIILPPIPELAEEHASLCDGFVCTGGDDPKMEQWGIPTHPKAVTMHPQRQEYETSLLALLRAKRPEAPLLGICLGMQMMCLDAGGTLDQHLADSLPTADSHRHSDHAVLAVADGKVALPGWLSGGGTVSSNHHQAVIDPGAGLAILARSADGVVEAVADRTRPFCIGVQWHPERTADERLGIEVFRALVRAAQA